MEKLNLKTADFTKIFRDRLAQIAPLSNRECREDLWGLNEFGIEIKRIGVVFIFRVITSEDRLGHLHVWLEDLKTIKEQKYPHWEVESKLHLFVDTRTDSDKVCDEGYSAYVVEEKNGGVDLLLNLDSTTLAERGWSDILERYGFSRIINSASGEIRSGHNNKLIDADILGKIREKNYLFSFAERYQMSNSQYLRFRVRTLSAKEGNISVKYDQIAKEIIGENTETN